MRRELCIFGVAVLLCACKPEEPPKREAPAEPAKAEQSLPKVSSSTELGKPLVQDVESPAAEDQPTTAAAPGDAVEPEATVAQPPVTKKAPVVPKTKPAPSIEDKLPEVSLDLTLPEEIVSGGISAKPTELPAGSSVLPPMFNPRESNFSLNGRIISQEREQDIDGAELRLEFRH
jgi:hypothetical protein